MFNIELITGKVGGFKSYSATKRAVGALLDSATVAGNLALKPDAVMKFCRDVYKVKVSPKQFLPLSDEQMMCFWENVPKRCFVVVDEAHLYCPSLDSAREFRNWVTFSTQSRKYDIAQLYITQSAENLHAQIRRLVVKYWTFRDLQKWKIPLLGMYWPFPQYLSFEFDQDGRTLLERKTLWKDPRIYELYETLAIYKTTFKTLEGFEHARAEKIETPRDWWRVAGYVEAAAAAGVAVGHFAGVLP